MSTPTEPSARSQVPGTSDDASPASTPAGRASARPSSARLRRLRCWTLSLLFVISTLASVVLANLIVHRVPTRIDVTGIGLYELSPRTRAVLDHLDGDFELILAGPWNDPQQLGLDARIVAQVQDTLREIARRSPHLNLEILDATRPQARDRLAEIFQRLTRRERPAIDEHLAMVRSARAALAEAIARIDQVQRDLAALAQQAGAEGPIRAQLSTWSQQAGVLGADLRRRADAVDAALSRTLLGSAVPPSDEAAQICEAALSRFEREMSALAQGLRNLAENPQTPLPVADALPPLASRLEREREAAARSRDALERTPVPDAIRASRALERASVALLIGPPGSGLTAIDLGALFPTIPPEQAREGLEADLRGHTESVITLALSALINPNTPIVVFVHANAQANLFESGAVARLRRELEARRIDTVEWGVVAQASAPNLAELDPAGTRPLVYVVIPTDAGVAMGDDPALSGPSRARRLAQVVADLMRSGEALLVSLQPSVQRAWGETDELARTIEAFGLRARTDLALLRESRPAGQRVVEGSLDVLGIPGSHPIADSLGMLPVHLRWAVPIEQAGDEDGAAPLLRASGEGIWGESEWQGLWQTRTQALAWSGVGVPTPTPRLDDLDGPWDVAFAASRASPQGSGTQRLVVVGANGWFFDAQRAAQVRIEGVTTAEHPGNGQLFESAVLWLSGQDELIAQGPSARAVARIGPIPERVRLAIAWGLIAGLPLGVLFLGLLWRLLMG